MMPTTVPTPMYISASSPFRLWRSPTIFPGAATKYSLL